jgi:hypothetical protein
MYHYHEAITNTKGDALIGYYVRAVDSTAGTAASLYADESATPIVSVSGLADAALVDSDGNASFFIVGGTYHLDIYATDGTTFIRRIESIPMVDFTVSAGFVADRTELAAKSAGPGDAFTLTESGREGTFVFSSSDLSALVTADTAQGIYVAPASDTTGASGAWVRKFSGPAESTWFGVSTSATAAANVTAFTAALATLYALRITGYGYNSGSIGLHTTAGHYTFDNTLSITHALEISGDFTRASSGGGTVFEWTASVHGFQGLSTACNGATIRGFMLQGNNGGTAKHAINQTGNLRVEDCYLYNWSGNGINADSTSGGLSGSTYRNILGQNVGWTLYIQGSDSNGCTIANVSTSVNRFGGIFDSSGIGNTIVGGVTNSCGRVSGYVTRCHSGGHIYAVAYGQEAGASANAPSGTTANNTYWWYVEEGTAQIYQPTWTAAQTWYFSAPICVEPGDGNIRTAILGHYVETDLNPIVLNDPSIVIGGQILVPVLNSSGFRHGGYIRGNTGLMLFNNAIHTQGPNGNNFENSLSSFGLSSGASQDVEIQLLNNNEYSQLSFYRQGAFVGKMWSAGATDVFYDFDTHNWRTKDGGSGTALASLTTGGYNLKSGAYQVNGTTAIDSSRNGSFAAVTATSVAINGGTALTKAVVYTPSITPASVAAATVAEQTFTVTGLTTADKVIVNPPAISNATGIAGARVSAADTLAIRFVNPTAGALTPTSGTYTVLAFRS